MKKWLKSPWGISLGTALFSFILTIIYDLLKDKPVFSTLLNIIIALGNLILSFLNFEIKVWWLIVGIILLILVLFVLSKIESVKSLDDNSPQFLKYKSDIICSYSWEWDWVRGYGGKWAIDNLHPICAYCKTPLVPSAFGYPRCIRCSKDSTKDLPNLDHVKMLIYDNVKKNQL